MLFQTRTVTQRQAMVAVRPLGLESKDEFLSPTSSRCLWGSPLTGPFLSSVWVAGATDKGCSTLLSPAVPNMTGPWSPPGSLGATAAELSSRALESRGLLLS